MTSTQLAFALVGWTVLGACSVHGQSTAIRAGELATIVLATGDTRLADHGPCALRTFTVDFSGKLHVWARSTELDPFLRIEDSKGALLAEDDDSGAGTTACILLDVEPSRELVIRAASAQELGAGTLELHVAASPESDATRAATRAASVAAEEIDRLLAGGESDRASALARDAIDALLALDGGARSAPVADSLYALSKQAERVGDDRAAAAARERLLDARTSTLPDDHPEVQRARRLLAASLFILRDLPGARGLYEQALESSLRTLGEEHVDVQKARNGLAGVLAGLGDIRGARDLMERAVEVTSRTAAPDDPLYLRMRQNLGLARQGTGDLAGAKALFVEVIAAYEVTVPDDDSELQRTRMNLATTLCELGDLRGALALYERALTNWSKHLPPDHIEIERLRSNIASTLDELGDYARARELLEGVIASLGPRLAVDDPDLTSARLHWARVLQHMGEFQRALAVRREVVAALEGRGVEDDLVLQGARAALASSLGDIGEVQEARRIHEGVVAIYARALPEDHPTLLAARHDLALMLMDQGDLEHARVLLEQTLEIRSRTSGSDASLQVTRFTLASLLASIGDSETARELREHALAALELSLPKDDLRVQVARLYLATSLDAMGKTEQALELRRVVLDVFTRTFPADHAYVQVARDNVAGSLAYRGDNEAACALLREAFASMLRTLPGDSTALLETRASLALEEALVDHASESRAHVADIVRALGSIVRSASVVLAPRELEALATIHGYQLGNAISIASGAARIARDAELERQCFACVEELRGVSSMWSNLMRLAAREPELAALRLRAQTTAASLASIVRSGQGRDVIQSAARDNEEAQRALIAHLRASGGASAPSNELSATALARTIDGASVIVSFRRYERFSYDPDSTSKLRRAMHLLAFVLHHDDTLDLIDLGPIEAVEDAVEHWRAAIVAPDLTVDPRGVAVAPSSASTRMSESEAGERLRRLVLDPLRKSIGDAQRLIVATDDALHAVPIDALPLDAGLVGDRFALELRCNLRELLEVRDAPRGGATLLALGGADFDAKPDARGEAAGESPEARSRVAVGAPGFAARSNERASPFAALPATLIETRSVANLFRDCGAPPTACVVLTGRSAGRASFVDGIEHARYVHVATHGWFAPESVASSASAQPLDARLGIGTSLSRETQVRGSSPLVLCGLALAGANLPPDDSGNVSGIITAEELASRDLSSCELAVLSACDTHVGVRSAGQGVASLQKALHMAGAQSVITSLWKVPDEATKELMLDFYRRLWVEKKPKGQALWEAKRKLRNTKDADGGPLYTTRDWAAWVLTGEPE